MNHITLVKAPAPDLLHAFFYKKCWNINDKNISHMIIAFLKHGYLLRELNKTHITLIPKNDNPRKVSDCRRISLCNVTYKLILKLLANRLHLVLPKLISASHSAFVSEKGYT